MARVNHTPQISLAHCFNEELTIILNSATIAAGMIGPEHPANDIISELKLSAIRCAQLARKANSRPPERLIF
jgi:hypothetical protein